MVQKFYVYAHYDDTGRVFYIGKGVGNRAYKWGKGDRSVYWKRHVSKHCLSKAPAVQIWADNLTEDTALAMEQEWIKLYGRRDKGTGRLVNLTDGGDNPPSRRGKRHSDKTRVRMSEAGKHKDLDAFFKGGEVTRFKKGQVPPNKGKPMPAHVKQALLNSPRRCRQVICLDTSVVYKSGTEAAIAVNGDSSSISKACQGKIKLHKGLRWAYIKENK